VGLNRPVNAAPERASQRRTQETSQDNQEGQAIADQPVALAEYAATALVAAGQLGIKTKAVEAFPLDEGERQAVAGLPPLAAKLKKRLAKEGGTYTVAEVAGMVTALAGSFLDAQPKQQVALLVVARKLMDCLQAQIAGPKLRAAKRARAARAGPADSVYQFQITLLGTDPPIWRRIRVKDGTLSRLHEHIQTAMGWTNSHLHHFRVGRQLYGDPDLMQENFEDMEYEDSTTTKISNILPKTGRRLRFEYEYDFGDGWRHEVLFEGVRPAQRGQRYPVCIEGGRACPPEDVGGTWGYREFLEAVTDPDHEDHDGLLEWAGGSFDPEAFGPAKATKAMRQGLPDWRRTV
jgi:hypothetical protein